jgi:hypothetical protein
MNRSNAEELVEDGFDTFLGKHHRALAELV